ncbi:hypothetical protein V6S67_19725 [Arthrobacter sp. Soc17.1.1.1]|uniref:hypothetical protein n=1 Tax=Arthrobacter sp. Soc17.1.1.1 TaxID=3121277 RepID=UPI002FE4F99A
MSEDGIDDVVERGMRQLLTATLQIAERVARARQDLIRRQRDQQPATERAQQEHLRSVAADRADMRAVLAPVEEFQWWNKASAERIAGVYEAAEAWKDYDPAALQASARIRDEVKARYGIDTADLQGDGAYLQDAVGTQKDAAASTEELRKHHDTMALIAAAQQAELQREAQGLRGEMERLQVPEAYLADSTLLEALRGARDASDVDARTDAERVVAERVHLIQEDGLQGPTIDQLRDEIGGSYSGADDSLFQDAAFVAAAKDWHEARVLAEGGFVTQDKGLEARYEAAEKDLFSRIDALGRDIERDVLNDRPDTPVSSHSQQMPVDQTPAYGSSEHRKAFAVKLEGTGTPEEVKGRLVAAADQGSHPREATRQTVKVPAAPRRAPSSPVRETTKSGPTR